MKPFPLCWRLVQFLTTALLCVCSVTNSTTSNPSSANQVSLEPGGCTIGDAMGNATVDGRPVSWKNRDEDAGSVHFVKYLTVSGGAFGILGMGYGSFDLKMGVNDAGLSLQNSLCDNLPGTYSYDDFKLYILSHAGSIADVRQAIITNITGNPSHTLWSSSPAICAGFSDAHGYATLFELEDDVSPYYYEYNPTNSKRLLQFPKQVIARANYAHRLADQTDQLVYSYSGDFERYQTARDDLVDYADIGALDIKNWVKYIARHGEPGVDWMPNNDTTRAAMMVHGVNEGEDARIVTAWLGLGNPDYTIFVPAWAAQKTDLSARVISASSTAIGYVSDRLLSKNDRNSYDQYVNSLLRPVEDNIFEAVAAARSHWFKDGFNLDEATHIHKEAAETAWQTMNSMSTGSGRALNAPPLLTAINSSMDGLQVTFSLVASDSDGSITAYDWDFGDASFSTASSPTHSYASAGTFLVRARVVDNRGARNSRWQYVSVSASAATPTSAPTPTHTPTPTPTIAPTFTPTLSNTPIFADVPLNHPYHDEIEALYKAGYTAGCGTDPLRYCPDVTMNRAESAVFVERGIHSTSYVPPSPSAQVFADLPLDSWASNWVNGLWADAYTSGCGTNPLVYCPWQGHTRAEGAVFYLRMLNGSEFAPEPPAMQTFVDVALNAWYAGWAQAAYAAGLIPPCETSPELRFCPDQPLTRAMAAHMMVKAKGLTPP